MLSFEAVSYRYAHCETEALKNVSFQVAPGELVLVTGPSGCGKTTLMRLANGLAPQVYEGEVTGRITVAGHDASHEPLAQLSHVIGTLFQDPEEQFFALTVRDEIAFALKSQGVPADEVEQRVERVAHRLGLDALLDADIHTLSEGQKQKVGLAGLLVLDPPVLVLDEPSANLDPEATEELATILASLKAEGRTILVVDHRLYWLRDVADRVLVLSQGEVVEHTRLSGLTPSLCAQYGLRQPAVADVRQTLPRLDSTLSNSEAVFAVEALNFAYPGQTPLFSESALAIPAGLTALLGPNGAGKTTLARLLTGLLPAQGKFAFHGSAVKGEMLLAHAGLVLQNADHQLQMRTVLDEVAMAVAVGRALKAGKGFPKRTPEDDESAKRWLAAFHIADLAHRHPQSLSGGQKQRVVVACALAKDPDILILDEPTSGLDGANMAAMAAVLRDAAERGLAILLITHDLELLSICDRALDVQMLQAAS